MIVFPAPLKDKLYGTTKCIGCKGECHFHERDIRGAVKWLLKQHRRVDTVKVDGGVFRETDCEGKKCRTCRLIKKAFKDATEERT